ncbi:MAG: hypothetical protein K6F97_04615, partial [Lachnospiraceae bacterium]|nr:hypothetical protein [Lachnospiraceae bacterium]
LYAMPVLITFFLIICEISCLYGDDIPDLYRLYLIPILMNYLSFFIMMGIGTMLMQPLVRIEKENNVNQVLISKGVKISDIIFSKIILAIIISYATFLIDYLLMFFCYKLIIKKWIIISGMAVLRTFVLVPLIGVAYIEVLGAVLWLVRRSDLLLFFLDLGSIGVLALVIKCEITGEFTINIGNMLVIVAVAIALSILLKFIIEKVPKEYLVKIETK